MATITLNIPDATLPRVRQALCEAVGITAPDEQTNAAAKQALITILRNTVVDQERQRAQRELVVPPPPSDIT